MAKYKRTVPFSSASSTKNAITSLVLIVIYGLCCEFPHTSGSVSNTNQLNNEISSLQGHERIGGEGHHVQVHGGGDGEPSARLQQHHSRGRGETVLGPESPRFGRNEQAESSNNNIIPELHGGDSGDYYESGSYDEEEDENDEDPPSHWGESFNKNDTDQISEIEKEEELEDYSIFHLKRRAKIGKCCPFQQGLNSQGLCKPMTTAEQHFHRDR